MIQQIVVIFVVVACLAWAAWQCWRFISPRKGGGCAGGCGCGHESANDKTPGEKAEPRAAEHESRGTMMVRSDDLRARLKARARNS